MPTLNVIGEFFHNWESEVNFAAARDLTLALADTAPRGYMTSLLIAADTVPPQLDNLRANVQKAPLFSSLLPVVWRNGQAARPLDGEFLHALSPLAPLRTREEDDGSQSSVMVPHSLAWDAPEVLPKGQARQIRSFVRRALKHADVIVTPTHAVAGKLRGVYGKAISPRVLPLAAPRALIAGDDARKRRTSLGLPEKYFLTNAAQGDIGRLEWILDAYDDDKDLPTLVIINEGSVFNPESRPELKDRVISLENLSLADKGAAIDGALALAMPQKVGDCFYIVYAALEQAVPVVFADSPSITEITLDGGLPAPEKSEFAKALATLHKDTVERERLSVLASDRSRVFSWHQTAWQLWEIHANI